MNIQHLHSVAACIGDLTICIAQSVEQQQCTFKGTYALQVTRDRGILICMYLYTGSFLFRDRCFTVVLLTAIDLAFRYSWTNSRGSCRAYRSWNNYYKKDELFVRSFVKIIINDSFILAITMAPIFEDSVSNANANPKITKSSLCQENGPSCKYTPTKKLQEAHRQVANDFRSDVVTVPTEEVMQVPIISQP